MTLTFTDNLISSFSQDGCLFCHPNGRICGEKHNVSNGRCTLHTNQMEMEMSEVVLCQIKSTFNSICIYHSNEERNLIDIMFKIFSSYSTINRRQTEMFHILSIEQYLSEMIKICKGVHVLVIVFNVRTYIALNNLYISTLGKDIFIKRLEILKEQCQFLMQGFSTTDNSEDNHDLMSVLHCLAHLKKFDSISSLIHINFYCLRHYPRYFGKSCDRRGILNVYQHILPDAKEDTEICSICQESGTDCKLSRCHHTFHSKCLKEWFHVNCPSNWCCPLCRQTYFKNIEYTV